MVDFVIGFELTVEPPAEALLEIWTFHTRRNQQNILSSPPVFVSSQHCSSYAAPNTNTEPLAVPTGINWQ